MATVWQSVLALDARVQSVSCSHYVQLELLCLVVMDPAAGLSAGTPLFLLFTWVVKEKCSFFFFKKTPKTLTGQLTHK